MKPLAVSMAWILLLLCSPRASSSVTALQESIEAWQSTLQGRIGVAILQPNKAYWGFQDHQRFPMASTFKMLACAKLLHDSEQGRLASAAKVLITAEQLVPYSPETQALVGTYMSPAQACEITLRSSDNTAANIVLDAIGGPGALTEFLVTIGDPVTRLDRREPEVNQGRPHDLRDTTTAHAMVNTWQHLLQDQILTVQAQQQLTAWLAANQVAHALLRAALPQGWHIADRSGAGGYGARGINAMIWQTAKEPIFISIYLHQTDASMAQRNQAIAAIAAEIFNYLQLTEQNQTSKPRAR
ncbi:class A beta-lactamase [Shewanella sp. NIFS-20-20]|uniref:class A beta-lactamase n=1 Tax=Shewanella sp. NIFS-20-20 TaxID=2853806 RepID=UPI001C491845|nr:class A beta-lactamase [Shewanella sp. NIFS-20-20]MBV7314542.1 class A beta-lactamase [Shewanella sp. NIFS-20-20]